MCIIAISKKGVRQPNENEIRTMFLRNRDGAGYMYARNGKVIIEKGFMNLGDYMDAIKEERFTDDDVVVYHFRISTQAGVQDTMTQPFPWSPELRHMKLLSLECKLGVCHNGIIRLTSNPFDREYSDTARFIAEYLTSIITRPDDLNDAKKMSEVYNLAQSKLCFLDSSGYVATVGDFIEDDSGIIYSNTSYQAINTKRFTLDGVNKTAFRRRAN